MSCLVAARTHATIAGFSNCVPTVSVAYSVKAWGINQMVFGHQRYVIDCRQLTASKVITVMEGLLKRRREIRAAMAVKVPRIKKSVYEAAHHLKSILSKSS
jgi:polysaccharide pyruvyl transferase WcaK-like protein